VLVSCIYKDCKTGLKTGQLRKLAGITGGTNRHR
jgi:hypothetical protein